jgi:hypothetical protein
VPALGSSGPVAPGAAEPDLGGGRASATNSPSGIAPCLTEKAFDFLSPPDKELRIKFSFIAFACEKPTLVLPQLRVRHCGSYCCSLPGGHCTDAQSKSAVRAIDDPIGPSMSKVITKEQQ